jgi:hypothetical protein
LKDAALEDPKNVAVTTSPKMVLENHLKEEWCNSPKLQRQDSNSAWRLNLKFWNMHSKCYYIIDVDTL